MLAKEEKEEEFTGTGKADSDVTQLSQWLSSVWQEFIAVLVENCSDLTCHSTIQVLSFRLCFGQWKLLCVLEEMSWYQCKEIIQKDVDRCISGLLLSNSYSPKSSISLLCDDIICAHDDLKWLCLQGINTLLRNNLVKTEAIGERVFAFLAAIDSPESSGEMYLPTSSSHTARDEEHQGSKQKNKKPKLGDDWPKQLRKAYSHTWIKFLSLPSPIFGVKLKIAVLRRMDVLVLPHLPEPLLLIDFLCNCPWKELSGPDDYAVAILSLTLIFLLMKDHGLEFPNYYGLLYGLLTPFVFHSKYRLRLFTLMDTSLGSSHLPAYIAAAFAKKLARLSLTAPPSGILLSLPAIYNLLKRHSSARSLVKRKKQHIRQALPVFAGITGENKDEQDPEEGSDLEMTNASASHPSIGIDPFDQDCTDLSVVNAGDSFLWEICSLEIHHTPQIASLAKLVLRGVFDKPCFVIADFAGGSYASFFEQATRKKYKVEEVGLALSRSGSLLERDHPLCAVVPGYRNLCLQPNLEAPSS